MASNKLFTQQPTVHQGVITGHGRAYTPHEMEFVRKSHLRDGITTPIIPRRPESGKQEFAHVREGDVLFSYIPEDGDMQIGTNPFVWSVFDGETGCVPYRVLGVASIQQQPEQNLTNNLVSMAVFGAVPITNTGRHFFNVGDRLVALPPDVTPNNSTLVYGHINDEGETIQRYVAEIYPEFALRNPKETKYQTNELFSTMTANVDANYLGPNTRTFQIDEHISETLSFFPRVDLIRRLVPFLSRAILDRTPGDAARFARAMMLLTVAPHVQAIDEGGELGTIATSCYTHSSRFFRARFNVIEFARTVQMLAAHEDGETDRFRNDVGLFVSGFLRMLARVEEAFIDVHTLGISLGTAESGGVLDILVTKKT